MQNMNVKFDVIDRFQQLAHIFEDENRTFQNMQETLKIVELLASYMQIEYIYQDCLFLENISNNKCTVLSLHKRCYVLTSTKLGVFVFATLFNYYKFSKHVTIFSNTLLTYF